MRLSWWHLLAIASLLTGCSADGPSTSGPPAAGGENAQPAGGGHATGSGASGGLPGGGDGSGGSVAGSGTSFGGEAGTSAGGMSAGATTGGTSGDGGGGGVAGESGSAGTGGGSGGSGPPAHKELILYDDDGKLWYVNNERPELGWSVNSGTGRDLQLVGDGRVMLGKSNGWAEFRLSDGEQVGGRSSFSGIQAVHRLADGRTMLAAIAGGDIVLRFVTSSGAVDQTITYRGYTYVRLVRPTAAGTFLVTSDDLVFEGDATGKVLESWPIAGTQRHVWKAMRLADGNTVIATGYNATLDIYGPDQKRIASWGKSEALASLEPHFFADFHVMANGDYFIVNSQADSRNDKSVQLLQLNSKGDLVWQQKQPNGVRSLEAAIVLDGLDTSKLHVEPQGVLVPVP